MKLKFKILPIPAEVDDLPLEGKDNILLVRTEAMELWYLWDGERLKDAGVLEVNFKYVLKKL